MAGDKHFTRWSVQESDLKDIDTVKARDLIVKCFFEAQKETFARIKQDMGASTSEEDLKANVLASIKKVFRDIDADFEKPSKADIMKAIETLGKKAATWGTPTDIIEFHQAQIMKILSFLK